MITYRPTYNMPISDQNLEYEIPRFQGYKKQFSPQPVEGPKEETQVKEPVVEETPTIKRGTITYNKGVNVGNMQHILDRLADAGISVRVTSGLRKAGAAGKAGKKSHHVYGNAVDIVPDNGETWDSMDQKIKSNPELIAYFRNNGFGILDETNPEIMRRTGATGKHWHVGYDKSAIDEFNTRYAKRGGILKKQWGGYMWDPKSDAEKSTEPTLDDLVDFTGAFETFSPSSYKLRQSDGKMQTLAGYGSADKNIINLANRGLLTEEMARKELKAQLQKDYDDWTRLVPNFKNLPIGVQLALVDTSYNGRRVPGTIKSSPKLIAMINSGVIDPKVLVTEMDHSKTAGGWLGVRSAARRAMALGEYNWNWAERDKYGRQIDSSKYQGPKDHQSSPYYGRYAQGGVLFAESGIHIKESHKGKLTRLKKRTGKTETELYATGSPEVRKMVTFSRNARKWNKK